MEEPIITEKEIESLTNRSPMGLPTNPTRSGMSETQVKKAMVDFILGRENSLVTYTNRAIRILGQELNNVSSSIHESLGLYDFGKYENNPSHRLQLMRSVNESLMISSNTKVNVGELVVIGNNIYFGSCDSTNTTEEPVIPTRILNSNDRMELINMILKTKSYVVYSKANIDFENKLLYPYVNEATSTMPMQFENLGVGTSIHTMAINEPDYWWDGNALIEYEGNTDFLDQYYTKSEVDKAIDDAITNAVTAVVGRSY